MWKYFINIIGEKLPVEEEMNRREVLSNSDKRAGLGTWHGTT